MVAAGADAVLGGRRGIGVVEHMDPSAERSADEFLCLHPDPALVDIRGRHDHAADDHAWKSAPDGQAIGQRMLGGYGVDHHADRRRDSLRSSGMRRVDANSTADKGASPKVNEGAFDAGPSNVDAKADQRLSALIARDNCHGRRIRPTRCQKGWLREATP